MDNVENAKAKKTKKISKIIGIVSTVFLLLCVGILLYSTISYSNTGLVKCFGYSFHTIKSPSMEPEIKVDDLVIVKSVSFDQIDIGDDILFKCEDTTSAVYGKYVVHRVKEKTETEGVYITYGINNGGIPDKVPSKAEGKVVKVSSSLGGLFNFVTQGRNIIFVVAIAGIIIFSIMQLGSVIANSAKLKAEKDKEKLNADSDLKERIKREVEEELLKSQNNQIETNDIKGNSVQTNDKNKSQTDTDNQPQNNDQQISDKKNIDTGSDGVWSIH